MTNAPRKITLACSRDIPFGKLMLSQSNVRRVKSGLSIEELAESIARRGLIQSLHVRPVLDADGKETGMFEVPAGGRRYRALELLVKHKRLARSAPVPCVVSEADSGVRDSTRPPDWARRLRRDRHLSHGTQVLAHAVRSGDGHGGGSAVSLSESDRA